MSKTIILGAGESGVGAALLAQKLGQEVFVSDFGQIGADYIAILKENNIAFEQGKHTENIIQTADLVIKSPGISEKIPLIQALQSKGIPVIDELEFAFANTNAKIIAITGSNGKTTTTKLIYQMLDVAGYDVGLAGNIGFSLAKQVAQNDRAYYVVEVSSFQLDGMYSFCPDIAVLLNITPDHLDRYDYELKKYIASKFRLVQNKGAEQFFIFNSDDENIKYGFEHYYNGNQSNMLGLSMAALLGETLELNVPDSDFSIPKSELTLTGRHNYFDIQAAVLAAKKIGISNEKIAEALHSFQSEVHRLEPVCAINGIDYINDSKATNVDAAFYALEAMQKPIIWIVGGQDKGNDYSLLFSLVKQKVRAIVCLGKDNSKIFKAFEGVHDIILETNNVNEAIKIASLYAEQGDVVLLSPACASFDLFQNYKERGNQFKNVLLQQLEILTGGQKVKMTTVFKMNPTDNKRDS